VGCGWAVPLLLRRQPTTTTATTATMIAKMKTTKRRSVQAVKVAIGSATKTQDPDYDAAVTQFGDLNKELMEIGACTKRYMEMTREWTSASTELAAALDRFYRLDSRRSKPAAEFLAAQTFIGSVLRRSVAQVTADQVLGPLRTLCGADLPLFERRMHEREGFLQDFDSYRRRVADLSTNVKADPSLKERMQAKLDGSSANYTRANNALKQDMGRMLEQKADLIDCQIASVVATQAEMLRAAHERMAAVAAQFPPAEVQGATRAVQEYVRKGGPPDAGSVSHTPAIGNNPMASRASGAVPATSMYNAVGTGKKRASIAKGTSGPGRGSTFGGMGGSGQQKSPVMPAPSSAAAAAGGGARARAEFDYAAAEEGELSFKAGDTILVRDQDPSGWWEGTVAGRSGVFPSNYVKVM